MQSLNVTVKDVLKRDNRFVSQDWDLLKNIIREQAEKLDENLITLLLENDKTRNVFFKSIKVEMKNFSPLLFDSKKFIQFLNNKEFLADSYTSFKNKIWLTNTWWDFISSSNEVVLNFPYKDCVLAWWQDKEDVKRNEVFYNEILWSDDIDRLLDEKVFTNFKRYDKKNLSNSFNKGEQVNFNWFNRDKDWIIKDNLIIKWNNLLALHSLKSNFAWKIKLIYIDPPYNTWNDSFWYNDKFNHSTWLTFMKNRLEIARELLSDDWSIYVNIDYNQIHYLKILMDEVFWIDSFQREIIWRIWWLSWYKTIAKNYIRNHDTILFYTKNPNNFIFNKVYNKFKDYSDRFNNDHKKEILKKLKELNINKDDSKVFLNFISKIGFPEKYPLEDTWNSSIYDKLNSIAVVSFSWEKVSKMLWEDEIKWQKSEALLKRIIEVSTNPWDIVLDYHLWSWTTCAVAHKMWRQYIGVEQMDYIENITVERMKKVIEWEQGGISKNVEWKWWWKFVYMELMKSNQNFMDKIEKVKTKNELLKIYEEIKESWFVNYYVDIEKIDENAKEFEKLSIENMKKFLIEILDKNMLYVNYSEIEDDSYWVSEGDKGLNGGFYN